MSLIDTKDLTWMQSVQAQAMPNAAIVIQRMTETSDGRGGFTEAWAAVGTVTGRVYPVNSRAYAEFEGGSQLVSETRWYLTAPVGTDITAKDRILTGGRTFEVSEVNNDEDYQTALRAQLTALNEELRP